MPHNNHTKDLSNKDINIMYSSREDYLRLTDGFQSLLPKPILRKHEGVTVVREDLTLKGGTKTRAGEFMFSKIKHSTVVYVTPRVGHAGIAIMELCKLYNKNAIFFMPACKEISDHQAAVIDMGPKDVIFRRIPAMPNLNRMANQFAIKNNYFFIPFGLNSPLTIAGFVRITEELLKEHEAPEELWTAVSTGVMTRGLQIGFKNTKMKGVAVARNLKAGEIGRTEIISEPLPFTSNEKEKNLPPFETVPSYDGKVWKYIAKNTGSNIWFWNVAKNIYPSESFNKTTINSYKDWNQQ